MKKFSLVLILASLLLITPAVAQSTPHDRGMWIWSSAGTVVRDAGAQDAFMKFLHAPHKNTSARINHVFLAGDTFNFSSTREVTKIRAFLKRAHKNNISVEFLTGNPKWARTDQMKNVDMRVDKVIAFNAGASVDSERFDGMHLDIEPYLLSEWKTGALGADGYNDELEKNYLDILKKTRAKINASGQDITLSVDIPTWFSAKASEIWIPLTSTDTPVSYLTIMNYFDSEKNFLYGYGGANKSGGIGPNLAASRSNIPLMFGAETKTDVEASVTFGLKGRVVMESAFTSAQAKFGESPSFGGVAVHHYDSYRKMRP